MRLIDADKITKVLTELQEHSLDGKMNIENVLYLISIQNTAYDVDKVVEELEEEREYSYANFTEYVEEKSPCLDADYDDLFHRGIERSIKIIKAG